MLSLFDIENSGISGANASQRRIIFICFSMMDNVYKVLQSSFARKDLLDPFLNSDYELIGKNRRVCFVANEYSDHITKNKIISSVLQYGVAQKSCMSGIRRPRQIMLFRLMLFTIQRNILKRPAI